MTEIQIKEQMCEIGRRVYDRGMVASNDGNFSVKLNDHAYLCTPTGVSKGFMTPEYICKVDENCEVLEANPGFQPSCEVKMHMQVYRNRPDIRAVVHAHPPYATTFAIARMPLDKPIVSEAVIALGPVPVADYATPSTGEVPEAVAKYVKDFDAMLLANHGALAYGDSLMNAYYKMESLEYYARLLYQSMQLGKAVELTDAEVDRLYDAFHLKHVRRLDRECRKCE